MKIFVFKPVPAVQISKSVFLGFPIKIEVNRAVQTSLKNCPISTVRGNVWIDCVHVTGIITIFKKFGTASVMFLLCGKIEEIITELSKVFLLHVLWVWNKIGQRRTKKLFTGNGFVKRRTGEFCTTAFVSEAEKSKFQNVQSPILRKVLSLSASFADNR